MTHCSEKIGESTFDGLLTDLTPAVQVRGGVLRKLDAAKLLPRGTLLAKSYGTAGDGKLVALGTAAKSEETLTPDSVLCADTLVGAEQDEPVSVYTAGCFALDKVTAADRYTVTDSDLDALRVHGIVFKTAQ